ncbi:MAG TPA: hypothetical protein DCP92_10990 [Nitrospiraceae bacterium]|nr:hypothetical protein [Nitrospiraceae bacterium]
MKIVTFFEGVQAKLCHFGAVLILLLAVMFLSPSGTAIGAVCNSTGTGNWSTAGTWSCSNVPAAGDTVTILTGNNVTVDVATATVNSLTVNSGGILTVTTFNVSATTISVSGTMNGTGAGTITGTLTFNSGGTYIHAKNGGAIPTATWNAGSVAEVTGVTTIVPTGLNQAFANFTWDSAQTASLNLNGTLTTVNGNFTVSETTASTTLCTGYYSLWLANAATGTTTITIGGDFIGSGNTSINLNRGAGTVVINVGGNFNYTGAYLMSQNGSGAPTNTTFNFTGAGKTFLEAVTGAWLNFTCSIVVTSNVSFVVGNGASLTMDSIWPLPGTNSLTVASGGTLYTSTYSVGASTDTGSFTLASGGTLGIGSPAGITSSGATGNVQVTGARTFNTGANYIYDGTAAQVTGNGLPATVNTLTINNAAGVTLTASTTVTNALTVTSGTFNQGSTNNLTAGSISVSSGATFSNVGTGSITLNGGLVNNGTVIIDGNGIVCPGGTPTSPISITSAASQAWSGSGAFQLDNVTLTNQTTTLGIAVFGGTCGGGGCSNFDFQTCASAPTAVKLKNFTATFYNGKVLLQWQTGYEVDNLGFHLYRENNGKLYRLTPEVVAGSALIAGPRIALTAGRPYTWWDDSLPGGQSNEAKYWLQDVDLSGKRTLYGPVAPVSATGLIPQVDQSALLSRLAIVQPERTVASSISQPSMPLKPSQLAPLQPVDVGDLSNPQTVQRALAGTPAVKFLIQEEGWYRVSQPELVAYGLDNVNLRNLQLFVSGQEVPLVVNEESKGQFGPNDSIEFYGIGLDTPSTDTQTYWLVVGSGPGERVSQVSGGLGTQELPSFPFKVEARPRVVYAPALPKNKEGDRFYGPLVSTDPLNPTIVQLNVNHPDAAPQGKAVLEVYLQGVTAGQHTVTVVLNGDAVGQVVFEGQNADAVSLEVTQSGLLQQGENQVELVAQGGETDFSVIDVISLTYWHTYMADNDALRFSANGGGRLSIGGFSTSRIRVFDITNPATVSEVTGVVNLQGPPYDITIGIPGAGSRTLLALTDGQVAHPAAITANNPSTWHSSMNKADMVIISHNDFIGTLGPLKKLRESLGLSVALIDVEDLYDEFNFGNKAPQALLDFLLRASSYWQKPPRFVLLVGDASVDPRNYLGYGDFDFVPTKLIETANNETASDDWFVDFNRDGLPTMAIGRITVRTAGEATTVITKIIGYEQQPGGTEWAGKALFVADIPDTFNFEASSEQVEAVLPSYIKVETIFRSKFASDALANQQLLNSIDNGALLVNYMGHGSENSWNGDLFTTDDVGALSNGLMLPFFLNMTCWNGWFPNPYDETLAESLLKAGQGGAVAVWASSGLTDPEGQLPMNKQLITLLFNGKPLTIGEATAKAKAATSDMDVRRTWILFGDPATRLK